MAHTSISLTGHLSLLKVSKAMKSISWTVSYQKENTLMLI